MADINIVLVEPEIPHNTGAIGRVCVGLNASLHLIKPLGFRLDDESIRRCGLDYWEHLDLHVHLNWQAFLADTAPERLVFLSTRGKKTIFDAVCSPGTYLVFGSESRGLPAEIYDQYKDSLYEIPMPGEHARSINLANAVSVASYEAYRQIRCC